MSKEIESIRKPDGTPEDVAKSLFIDQLVKQEPGVGNMKDVILGVTTLGLYEQEFARNLRFWAFISNIFSDGDLVAGTVNHSQGKNPVDPFVYLCSNTELTLILSRSATKVA